MSTSNTTLKTPIELGRAVALRLTTKTQTTTCSLMEWLELGLVIEASFLHLTLSYAGTTREVYLPVSVSSILEAIVLPTSSMQVATVRLLLGLESLAKATGYYFGKPIEPLAVNEDPKPPYKVTLDTHQPDAPLEAAPVSAPTKTEAVALKNATFIGEKILGTSAGSVYYVIALSHTANLAMSVKHTNSTLKTVSGLSFRVEGHTSSDIPNLEAFKFSKAGANHYSLHLQCATFPPLKIIGAVLFGLNLSFLHTVPVFKVKEMLNG